MPFSTTKVRLIKAGCFPALKTHPVWLALACLVTVQPLGVPGPTDHIQTFVCAHSRTHTPGLCSSWRGIFQLQCTTETLVVLKMILWHVVFPKIEQCRWQLWPLPSSNESNYSSSVSESFQPLLVSLFPSCLAVRREFRLALWEMLDVMEVGLITCDRCELHLTFWRKKPGKDLHGGRGQHRGSLWQLSSGLHTWVLLGNHILKNIQWWRHQGTEMTDFIA